MGAIMPMLIIGQAVLGMVTGVAQMAQARSAQQAANEAATRQIKASYAEITRQQGEVNRIAVEQASDRMRAANAELGTVRTSAGERGVSGTTMTGFARAIGALEGVDLSRIEKNRQANIAAGEAAKRDAQNNYITTVNIAANQASAATSSAWLGMAGSGLRIGADYARWDASTAAAQNKRT